MKTILVTGANRGFGLELVKRYSAEANTKVIACCRTPETATQLNTLAKTNSDISIEALDVADQDAIDALGLKLGNQAIDILINNAGIFGRNPPATTGFQEQRFGVSEFEGDWIQPYRVNVIGPMKITETLVENIAASELKKVVIITSIVGSIEGAAGHMFGYAASKAAANMTARNLAIALKKRNIMVNPIHPGYAKTDMGGEHALVEVNDAIDGLITQIDAMSLENSGEFLSYDGSPIPW